MKRIIPIFALLLCQLAAVAQDDETKYTLTFQNNLEGSCAMYYTTESQYNKSYDNDNKPMIAAGQDVVIELIERNGCQLVNFVSADTIMDSRIDRTNAHYTYHPITEFTMPDHDVTITAVMQFDPDLPDHPVDNDWNEATGSLVVTHFTTGHLFEAIDKATTVETEYGESHRYGNIVSLTVAGKAINQDMIDIDAKLRNLGKLQYLDLSRTDGITEIFQYMFNTCPNLRTIVMPASIGKIGSYTFNADLESFTIYATTPPELEEYAFYKTSPSLTIYVSAESLPLYAAADGWKNFNLMPITQGVHKLTVNMPANADMQQYKDMSLELVNTKTAQTRRYVLNSQKQYTFTNLIEGTQYNVYIRNAREDILGSILAVDIDKQDVEVTFADLKQPRDITLQLLLPDGSILPSLGDGAGVSFTWTDIVGNYLAAGATLTGQMEGARVIAKVKLGQQLGTQYVQPADTMITVGSSSMIHCPLSILPQVELTGTVTAASTDLPIPGANIAVTQQLNGLYPKTFTTTTDAQGRWTLTVFDAPMEIAAQATGYVPQVQTIPILPLQGELEGVALADLSGTTVLLDFNYTPATRPGEEPSADATFSSFDNISYTVYDETHAEDLTTDAVMQSGRLVLQDRDLAQGTKLRITATSPTNLFMPVTATCTVNDNGEATAPINITQLGQLKATFAQTDNSDVVGMLYDGDGQLQGSFYYDEAKLSIINIPDGSYTLVTMGESRMFNGVNPLDALTEMRLEEDRDYVKNEVAIQSGRIDSLHNERIPMLDESIFNYTTENTHFTANKSSITVGNYVTLRTQVEFKDGLTPREAKLYFDLPTGCSFVEGSVMAGNSLAQYELDGNRLTVPLSSAADVVRFCIMPTEGGYYEPTATVSFSTGWVDLTQPLGSVAFTAEALSFNVSDRVSFGRMPVSGLAIANSDVKIYESGQLIGHTEAGPDGTWMMTCSLNNAYNLSQHEVYAVITTPDGITMQTETQTVTISHGTMTPVVYCSNSATSGVIKWDFREMTVSPKHNGWPLGPGVLPFTFKVDFYNEDNIMVNDTTLISNVTLYVLLSDDSYIVLKAPYSELSHKWIAQADFSIDASPKNVFVDFVQDETYMADRQEADDWTEELKQTLAEAQQMVKDIYALPDKKIVSERQPLFDELKQLYAKDEIDAETWARIQFLLSELAGDDTEETQEEPADLDAILAALNEEKYQWRDDMLRLLSYAVSTDTTAVPTADRDVQLDVPLGNGVVHFTSKEVNSVSEQTLLNEGYSKMEMTDGTAVYMLKTGDKETYLDTRNMRQYTYEWEETAAARGNRRVAGLIVDSIFDMAEKTRLKEVSGQLFHLEDNSATHTLDGLAQTYIGQGRTLCRELAIICNNLYRDGLKNIKYQTREIYYDSRDFYEKWFGEAKSTYNWAYYSLRDLDKKYDPLTYKYKNEEERNWVGQRRQYLVGCMDSAEDLKNYFDEMLKQTDKTMKLILDILRPLPQTLSNTGRQAWVYRKAYDYQDTPIGLLLELYWGYYQATDMRKDLEEWRETYNAAKAKLEECKGTKGEAEAENICWDTSNAIVTNGRAETSDTYYHAHKVVFAGYLANDYNFDAYLPHQSVPLSWYVSSWAKQYKSWVPFFESIGTVPYRYHSEQVQLRDSEKDRKKLDQRIRNLKCDPEPKPVPVVEETGKPGTPNNTGGPSSPGGSGKWWSHFNIDFYHDPSGYVYEAVNSNRLEGVRASCYYKETVEDMYGDLHENIVLWDAEEYAQQNPLFTDAEGKYRWDVPQGLWQVKYEKAGYETTYSDWLPVPPPQLEVNVGMTQLRQPAVQRVKACTDGIDITFDKYMRPQTLTKENILVTKNGQTVGGKIVLLNAESGYQTPDSAYVSKVRFMPENANLNVNDKVQITVRKAVESYAGLQMEQDFTQQFDVEQRITAIVADSLIYMAEGSEQTLTVSILPVEAAKGKQLIATSLSEDVVTVLPRESEGVFNLHATGLGSGAVKFTLADDELTATTTVIVRDPANMYVYTPKASRMSGTEIYRGAQIKLTCATAGATILYTLDGSCPCDAESASVFTYTGPILATGTELVIKAMAVANGMAESDVAEFRYKVIDNTVGIEQPTANSQQPRDDSPVAYYSLDGRRLTRPAKGLSIVVMKDGTVKKVKR
jgi:hypothetical protein